MATAHYLNFTAANNSHVSFANIVSSSNWNLPFKAFNSTSDEFIVLGSSASNYFNFIILRNSNNIEYRVDGNIYNFGITNKNDPDADYEFRMRNGQLSLYENNYFKQTRSVSNSVLPSYDLIGRANVIYRNGGFYNLGFEDLDAPANNRYFDANASNGSGNELIDTVGNLNGSQINFPIDNTQWISYTYNFDPSISYELQLTELSPTGHISLGVFDTSGSWTINVIAEIDIYNRSTFFLIESIGLPEYVSLAIYNASNDLKIYSDNKTPGKGSTQLSGLNKVTLSWDGTKYYAFINDVLDYSVTPTAPINTPTSNVYVLKPDPSTSRRYLLGRVREFWFTDSLGVTHEYDMPGKGDLLVDSAKTNDALLEMYPTDNSQWVGYNNGGTTVEVHSSSFSFDGTVEALITDNKNGISSLDFYGTGDITFTQNKVSNSQFDIYGTGSFEHQATAYEIIVNSSSFGFGGVAVLVTNGSKVGQSDIGYDGVGSIETDYKIPELETHSSTFGFSTIIRLNTEHSKVGKSLFSVDGKGLILTSNLSVYRVDSYNINGNIENTEINGSISKLNVSGVRNSNQINGSISSLNVSGIIQTQNIK